MPSEQFIATMVSKADRNTSVAERNSKLNESAVEEVTSFLKVTQDSMRLISEAVESAST